MVVGARFLLIPAWTLFLKTEDKGAVSQVESGDSEESVMSCMRGLCEES